MTEQAKQARKEYKRKWRQEHPEAVKRHQETFWERQAAKAASRSADNPETPQRPQERIVNVDNK